MDQTTGAPQPHAITVEQTGGATLVVLRGEIDASLRHAASEAMVAVLAAHGPLVIDTSAVTFIDSSGMAFLLQLHGVATDAGRSVDLRDPSGVVVELLALVGLDTLFRPEEPQGV
jgi:anti-sigma B factor antagonist